jgi:hypothetical protein
MLKIAILFIIVALIGGTTLAEQQYTEKEIVVFDVEKKTLNIRSLGTSNIQSVLELNDSDLINPKLISSEGGNLVSLVEHAPNGEWLINLNTGEVKRHSDRYATIITENKTEFYFESREGPKDVLIRVSNGEKNEIHEFKKSSIPVGRVSGDNKISWFFRREGLLFTVDLITKETSSIYIKCRDAVRLGPSDKIFCINEVGNADIISGVSAKSIDIKGISNKFSVIAANPDGSEITLAKISTSMSLSSFLKEYHDIYTLDISNLELTLIKEKAVFHGTNYFVR